MRGYKVVTIRNGRKYSMCGGWGEVIYQVDRPTIPKKNCGPLTVLRTRKAAEHLIGNITLAKRLKIYPCSYVKSNHSFVWVRSTGPYSVCSLESTNPRLLIPGQTVLADQVTLKCNSKAKEKRKD